MARVTGATVLFQPNGIVLRADCFGNIIAVDCPACSSHPVLLIARQKQRGSSRDNPGVCRSCRGMFYITDDLQQNNLDVVHLQQV